MSTQQPQLSVVVASHDRPLRLRWLLNALDVQTLDRSQWEVVVAHDSTGPETDEVLAGHPLADSGLLRWRRLPPRSGPSGVKRNAAARLARAPTLVFTDDDCRPPPDWLENVLVAVKRHPETIVQGPVLADPEEWAMLRSPHPRTQTFTDVPRPWAETCNIVYPRHVIERIGGFLETIYSGEDTDLNLRARAMGTAYVGDPRMFTYHAIDEGTVFNRLGDAWRWGDLALLVKLHPQMRKAYTLRFFMRPSHVWLPVALLGLWRSRSDPRWAVLVAPWLSYPIRAQNHGPDLRGQLRTLLELPGLAIIDVVEMVSLARGSIRWRSLML